MGCYGGRHRPFSGRKRASGGPRVELTEVVQRVLWRHKLLIVALVLVCVAGGLALNVSKTTDHVARTRISIDGGNTKTDLASKSGADSALAIVTSRDAVVPALKAAGSKSDPDTFAKKNVALVPVGTSGVVDLSVTDASGRTAVTVANKLAQSLIDIRQQIGNGSLATVIANLNAELAQSDRRVQDFQKAIASLSDGPAASRQVLQKEIAAAQLQQHDLQVQHDTIQQAVARGAAPANATSRLSGLNARLAAGAEHIAQLASAVNDSSRSQGEQTNLLQQELASTLQQQAGIRADRQRNVEAQATQVTPVVISVAKVAAAPKSTLPSTLVLAALLGLILGLAAASVLEMLRPSVVGADALARVFGTSVLATLDGPPDTASPGEVGVLAGYLRLAATARGVDRVELLTVDDQVDLERLSLRLGDHLVASPEVAVLHLAAGAGSSLAPFDTRLSPDALNGETPLSPAMVLFAPKVSTRRALDPIGHLLAITGWPLLGVVTYDRQAKVTDAGKGKGAGKPAERTAPIHIGLSERPSVRTG